MYNFRTLKCHHCSSVIFNLPEAVINTMDGQTFICDCCNHANILSNLKFIKSFGNYPTFLLDIL